MEQRLIDATEFDTKLFNDGFFGGLACAAGNTPRKRKFTIGEFRGMLAKAPTVDAVPVVRCGECRHSFKSCPYGTTKLFCGHDDISMHEEDALFERNDTDFCSYGEKREEAPHEC